ncbi:hypothetical protein LOTGIDRAFT_232255 [Lottia gigantea]|uniref:39S ribosomal protein L20, mitochondrial n=1 Tax=Lottia gigantea TaxID=225164 RepID=V4AHX7_LOTGI|nr:hypothetical protein LOTGIDRAFT_232255 [Lottia gigantea]ESO94805.1 hypothetical protein LOTGIDRAFT_232255 [Lottia gigantea]
MHLTRQVLRNLPTPYGGYDISWKRQMYKRLAWHFFGRRRTCFRIQIRTVERALRNSTFSGSARKEFFKELNTTRLEAACSEHGVIYKEFLKTLDENDVQINKTMLEKLAIYEPRTFQSLCDMSIQYQKDNEIYTKNSVTPYGELTRGLQKPML